MAFLGREQELTALKQKLQSKKFEAILVYGRRRIGKTELINEAVRQTGKKCISYVCLKNFYSENIKGLSKTITETFNEDYLEFNDLEHILQYAFAKSAIEEFVLVIDEYPFLRGDVEAIDSFFQIAIDKYHSSSKMKLILCGSYIETMKSLVDSQAPLYGRFTHIIDLKPFDYYEASLFYPDISKEKKFEFYSVFGGVPFYLSLLNPKKSLQENIEQILIPTGSILENEITVQLNQEINKIENLNFILGSIGKGLHANKDLRIAPDTAGNISKDSGKNLEYYIRKLIGMDLIEKTSPINEPDNKKKFCYYISDNLLDFYYTFLYRNTAAREITNPKTFFKNYIEEGLKQAYLPRKFEDVSKEFLIRMNKADKIKPLITSIGRYVYNDKESRKNAEIDVATKDSNGWTCYECKYLKGKVDNKIIRDKLKNIKDAGLDFYQYGFISKNGFEDDVDKKAYKLYSLDDFFDWY